MINSRQAAKPAAVNDERREAIRSLYLEALQLVERLHRRLLDVIKDEFDRNGRSDINAIQAIDPNCIEFAAQAGIFSPPEGADSAFPTKYVVDVVGLVINELCFSR